MLFVYNLLYTRVYLILSLNIYYPYTYIFPECSCLFRQSTANVRPLILGLAERFVIFSSRTRRLATFIADLCLTFYLAIYCVYLIQNGFLRLSHLLRVSCLI